VGVTKFVDPDPRPTHTDVEPDMAVEGGGDACEPLRPARLIADLEAAGAA
jgi:methylmalonyl-CoA mutase